MGQKLVVPIAALVLVLGAAVAVWFLWPSDSPQPAPPEGNDASAGAPGNAAPLRLNPADFDPARIQPDPVTSERPPQPYTPPAKALRIVVAGRVVNESGVGIADARVSFHGDQQLRDMNGVGFSDAAGNYRLLAWSAAGLPNGERLGRVAAESPDGGIAVGEFVSIAEDAAEMPELVIRQGAVLEGQVLAADGAAVPGAKVSLRSAGPVQVLNLRGRAPEVAQRQLVRTVFADETGRYRFAQLPAATYSLLAEGAYFGASNVPEVLDLTSTAYGWQELRLSSENYIRGVLQDLAGRPIPGAVVKLIVTSRPTPAEAPPAGNTPAFTRADVRAREDRVRRFDDTGQLRPLGGNRVVTDAAGRFGFSRLADLEYTIAAKLGEAEARQEGARINQPDFTLQLEVTTSVSGLVRDAETGRAIEYFSVRVMTMGGEPQVTPFDRVARDGVFEHHPGGAWLAANPPLQDTVVRISAPGYAPLLLAAGELRAGDHRRDLDAALQPLCNLTFELAHEGRKLDLEPVVLLFDARLAFAASSDELGRVRIPDVPPAVYKVKVQLADGTVLEGSLAVPARRETTLTLELSAAG